MKKFDIQSIQVSIYPKKMDIHVSEYPCIQVCMISKYPIIQVSKENQYPRYPCIRIYEKSGIHSSLVDYSCGCGTNSIRSCFQPNNSFRLRFILCLLIQHSNKQFHNRCFILIIRNAIYNCGCGWCSTGLIKEIQIIHRLFLVIAMYCQASSMNH